MKKSNKGFTLVELIVVLVILAILAAILVPALLGYIDKAREKQTTTNAEAAYVAAQALATEAYGKREEVPAYITKQKIADLTDITLAEMDTIYIDFGGSSDSNTSDASLSGKTHKDYIIGEFTYYDGNYTAVWTKASGGQWTVTEGAPSSAAGTAIN